MMLHNRPPVENDKETTRLEAFSDGVFAIAITLMAFNIRVPAPESLGESGLMGALAARWPVYLAFVAGFLFILVMWINHHRLFTVIRRTDNTLMILNGLLMLGVTIVPFTTELVATYLQHTEQTTAMLVYNGWFLIVSVFFNLLWQYAAHDNRLFTAKTDRHLAAHITRQYAFGPFLYLAALLLTFINPLLGFAVNIGLAVFFAMPNKAVQQLIDSEG